jgi:transcriptional regulator with XRE-family HTH domain
MGLQNHNNTNSLSLREIRFRRGASQYSIQRDSGVHQSRVSLIERGLVKPTDKEMGAIAQALGVDQRFIAWPVLGRN